MQMYRGERIPDAKEQWTLANSAYRLTIKDRNALFRYDWEYESDEDLGEDLGGLGRKAALEEEAAGLLGSDGEARDGEEGGEKATRKADGDN